MYAQFFGNFLLSHNVVTQEQLLTAMEQKSTRRIKLGTLAIHAGYLNANEVEHIKILQTHKDRRFGELCIEEGLLTAEQVDELLAQQTPDFLLLGQYLVEEGIIDNHRLESLINEYQSENEIYDMDGAAESKEKIDQLFKKYVESTGREVNEFELLYNNLLFNNLIRFIGDDFTPIYSSGCTEYPRNYCVSQKITGPFELTLYIDMPESVCTAFATRYAGEELTEFDEYVQASLEDFANLHNGLYCVNISNLRNIELTLEAPVVEKDELLTFDNTAFMMPVVYPFGTINFIFELNIP